MDNDELEKRVSAKLTAAEVVDLLDITVEDIFESIPLRDRHIRLLREEVGLDDEEDNEDFPSYET